MFGAVLTCASGILDELQTLAELLLLFAAHVLHKWLMCHLYDVQF
jgi:hypothetical protein